MGFSFEPWGIFSLMVFFVSGDAVSDSVTANTTAKAATIPAKKYAGFLIALSA